MVEITLLLLMQSEVPELVCSEMGHADLASKELGDDCYPECEHKEDVGEAHLVAAWQLVWFAPDFIHAEAHREDYSGQAEQKHSRETHPSCIWNNTAIPA